MLRDYLLRIFNNFSSEFSKKNSFTSSNLVNVINEDIPQFLSEITPRSDNYIFRGNAGKGNWTVCPYIAILDSNVTQILGKGYYIIYIYSDDTKRLYLSLTRNIRGRLKSETEKEFKQKLDLETMELRKLIDIPKNFHLENLSLGKSSYFNRHDHANICGKEYTKESLPSEEELVSDYKEILRLYNSLFESLNKSSEHIGIKKFMETILRSYKGARERGERVGGHKLAGVFNEFARDLREFANSPEFTINPDQYITKSVHFGNNKFVNSPNVYLKDKKDYTIRYMFRKDMQGVYLALIVGGNALKKWYEKFPDDSISKEDFYKNCIKDLRNYLEEKTEIAEGFEESPEETWFIYYTIYAKFYEKGKIPSDRRLLGDLKEMLRLYEFLPPSRDKFEILSDLNEIKEAQNLFENRFKAVVDGKFEATSLGKKQTLFWSSKLGIWGFFADFTNRYINRFGIGKPEENSDNPTTCEINIPFEGVKKSISGSFAKDSDDNLYLLHNGSIYGHIVTKEDYSGSWVEIEDDDQTNDLILIGGLSDQDFPEKLRDFLIQIDRIKNNKVDNSIGSFFEFLSGNGYLFDPNLVENFLLSLKVKPFVILTGNSGTGKTKVAQLFAHYLAKKSEEYDNKKHEIVPVGANWTENRHVLGFYNVITENYQKTQALDLILNASIENQNIPYFLILDEMNLSHVERYFSDFLSGMESHEPIPLHDNDAEHIPQELELPNNLLVIGTVNVDETTYMFSPKVLDRANTIEFLTHSPLNYMSNEFTTQTPSGDLEYLQNPLSDIYNPNVRKMTIDDVRESFKSVKTSDDLLLWDNISEEIDNIYIKLKKAGFDFGFRVVNEIMRFMYVSWKYEGSPIIWENWERYFDAQIKQKILPKLHGSQRTLETTIKSLFEICYGESVEKDPRLISDQIISMAKFPTSALKLRDMDNILYNQRYVAFIN